MNRAKRLLSIYVAIFIAAILIAVPVAVYLLPPRAVPIEVQNGFAEYNWTSDHFYNWSFLNRTNGTDVELTKTVAIAIVHDPSNEN